MHRFTRYAIAFLLLLIVAAAPQLAAQATTPTGQLVLGILGLAIPPLATFISVQLVKKYAVTWLDAQSDLVQQIATFLVAALFTWLGHVTGLSFPGTVAGLDGATVSTLLNGLAAMGVHAIFKSVTTGASSNGTTPSIAGGK